MGVKEHPTIPFAGAISGAPFLTGYFLGASLRGPQRNDTVWEVPPSKLPIPTTQGTQVTQSQTHRAHPCERHFVFPIIGLLLVMSTLNIEQISLMQNCIIIFCMHVSSSSVNQFASMHAHNFFHSWKV